MNRKQKLAAAASLINVFMPIETSSFRLQLNKMIESIAVWYEVIHSIENRWIRQKRNELSKIFLGMVEGEKKLIPALSYDRET